MRSVFLFLLLFVSWAHATQAAPQSNWRGTWYRSYEKALNPNGFLKFETKNNETTFTFDAYSGANSGGLDGTLQKVSATTATFVDSDPDSPCQINFTLTDAGIQVEDVESQCASAHAGHGVFYDGLYKANKPTPPKTLAEMQVLPDANLDQKFQKLVGKRYKNFMENLDSAGEQRTDDKSKTVIDGGVSGVYVYMRAIIVYDKAGNIWAATTDQDTEVSRDTIYYYTNVTADKTKVPPEILAWDDRFHSDVVYEK